MITNSRQSQREILKVLQEHPLTRKKNPHPLAMTQTTNSAAKQNPVKSCYSTRDAVLMPCQKTLHDSPPLMLCAKDIMREEIMGRHHLRTFYFGCGPNGLRHVISWIVPLRCDKATALNMS